MQCRVEGCERDARYKAAQLCQKHYFRVRRNGGVDLKPVTAIPRVITPNGYVRVYQPGHPIAIRNYVFEHRMVMWGRGWPRLRTLRDMRQGRDVEDLPCRSPRRKSPEQQP